MREESETEESSEKEEDADEENVREAELVRPQAPISFHRFRFHLDSLLQFFLVTFFFSYSRAVLLCRKKGALVQCGYC